MQTRKAFLRSENQYLEVLVEYEAQYQSSYEGKSTIHELIGNSNLYEYGGKGSTTIKRTFITNNLQDYQSLHDLLTSGLELEFQDNLQPAIRVNVKQNFQILQAMGFWKITIEFTTAPQRNKAIFQAIPAQTIKSIGLKTSFFDKLKNFAKKVINFKTQANDKIQSVSNYLNKAQSMNLQIAGQIASSATMLDIIPNAIEDTTTSISIINASFTRLISKIQNTPGRFDDIFTDLTSTLANFGSVLNTNNKSKDAELNSDGLKDILAQNLKLNSNENTIGNSNRIKEIQNTNEAFKIVNLATLLFEFYSTVGKIDTINSIKLESYKATAENVYKYISESPLIDNEFLQDLNKSKSAFINDYQALSKIANTIIKVNVPSPKPIYSIVYQVNGNLDYLQETIELNNLINVGLVKGEINIIRSNT